MAPTMLTFALDVLDEVASYVSSSPSGSVKYGETSRDTELFSSTTMSPISPTASGAWLGTVTSKVCVAVNSSGSRAVTVTIALPPATPLTATTLPDTDTATRDAFDDVAPYCSVSPSGSVK